MAVLTTGNAGFWPTLGQNPKLLRVLGVAIVAFVALNVVMFAWTNNASGSEPLVQLPVQSDRYVQAIDLGDGRVVAATVDNELVISDGGEPVAATTLPFAINDIALEADDQHILAGLSNGAIIQLDQTLNTVAELTLPLRIIGVADHAEFGVVVVGVLGSAGLTQLSLRPALDALPVFELQVPGEVTSLVVSGSNAIIGTRNSRVISFDLTSGGAELWQATLARPITVLASDTAGTQIIAGDDRGNISLLNLATGEVSWTTSASEYRISSVAFDEVAEIIVAGDSEGDIDALSPEGASVYSGSAASSPIDTILTGENGLIVTPRDGAWQQLNAGALSDARQADLLRQVWLALNGLATLATAVAVVKVVPAFNTAARQLARDVFKARSVYLYVLPSFLLIFIFEIYPIGLAFWYSLTNKSLNAVTEFVGLENYRNVLFDDFYFRVGIKNLVIILLTDILKVVTVPLLTAELVFRMKNRTHRYLFRTIIVGSAVVPGLVSTLLWRMIYQPEFGLIDQLLGGLSLASWQRSWLGTDETALWAIIGTGFPFLSSFAFLIYLGGLMIINPELYDSAEVDGANWFQRFLHIDVPLLIPQFRLLLFFSIGGAVQAYSSIFILTRGGPGHETFVPALQMYLEIASGGRYGYASAIGIVLVFVVLALTLPALRFRRSADTVQA